MRGIMTGSVILASVAIIFLVFSTWTKKATKSRHANWTLAAESVGLKCVAGAILGRLDGFQIYVGIETNNVPNGSLKSYSTESSTVFRAEIEDLPDGLSIEPEGLYEKAAKLLGAEDVQLGLFDLDPKLMVKAKDVDATREWAQREGVAAGLHQLSNFGTFRIQRNALRFECPGTLLDPQEIRARILELVSMAALISHGVVEGPLVVEQESNDTEENSW
jgi:hypothetical protein